MRLSARYCIGFLVVLTFIAPVFVSADYAAEVTADSPMSWWRFEDVSSASGSAAADSAGAFPGTYNGDIELVEGLAGNAAYLDGDFDYVDIGAMGAVPVQGSIEFWMRPEVVENYRNVLTTGLFTNTNAGGIRFEENTIGDFKIAIGDDSGGTADYLTTLMTGLEAGQWVHVVTTWDTALGLISVYIDGEIVVDDDANTFWPTQLGNVVIGMGYGWWAERSWLGNIDEVAIYDSRLSAGRVRAHYDAVTHGEQQVVAPTPWGWNIFGFSADIDGETAIIGAPGFNDAVAGGNAGAAYVYQLDDPTGEWVEVIRLASSDLAEADQFGYNVAISGDIAVVGAIYNDQSATDGGSAYVFYRDHDGPDAWGEVAKLVASDAGSADLFGYQVAIDGSTVVVGALNADGVGTDSGKAYVFEKDADGVDSWGEVKILTATDAVGDARFGGSISISGDTVAIGAFLDPAGGVDSGAAYVFDRDQGGAGTWGQVTKLTASDAAADARFGFSISIDGDSLVVGADRESGAASEAGAAYVFDRNLGGPDLWGERAKLVPSEAAANDHAGRQVGINNNFIVVGSGNHDGDPTRRFDTGAAYAFSRDFGDADAWGEIYKYIASDQGQEDFFGDKGIAVGDSWIVIGAYGWDGEGATGPQVGAAYFFMNSFLFADGFESGTTDAWN